MSRLFYNEAMEEKNLLSQLVVKVKQTSLPEEEKKDLLAELANLKHFYGNSFYLEELYRYQAYLKWLLALPFNKYVQDNLDLAQVRQTLDKYHYGLDYVKKRILEYLAVMKLRAEKKEKVSAPVILLTGLVGTGKTTFAYSLAQALGRPIIRIAFGGLASSNDLRGRSRLALESEPGLVTQALIKAKVNNPVILLDEIDRIDEEVRMSIMGVLVEMLDPEQNYNFRDYFINYPIDLSSVFFLATSNNTQSIATAVLDRLEVIEMPSYSDQEKIIIAEKYLLPKAIEDSGLKSDDIIIKKEVWPLIIRPIGYEGGVRTLNRIIKGIARGIALKIVQSKQAPFILDKSNYRDFLPSYLI